MFAWFAGMLMCSGVITTLRSRCLPWAVLLILKQCYLYACPWCNYLFSLLSRTILMLLKLCRRWRRQVLPCYDCVAGSKAEWRRYFGTDAHRSKLVLPKKCGNSSYFTLNIKPAIVSPIFVQNPFRPMSILPKLY